MKPASLDLEIYKGDTFEVFFRVRAKNTDGTPGEYLVLTGGTVKSQIRATATSPQLIAEFAPTLSDQIETPGGITLTLTPELTTDITDSIGVWDVQVTKATGETNTYLAGKVTFINQVTHV